MLVLSRKTGEEIRIGDDVVIQVVRIQGNRVRIGIKAPGHIPIARQELLVEDAGREARAGGDLRAMRHSTPDKVENSLASVRG